MRPAAPWPLPRVVAHRGGGVLAPENTLAGLRLAASAGCHGVEFDVMLSGNGTPLLIHDEWLERTTTGRGRVAATPDAVLRRLDAGAWFDPQRFRGEPLPFLDEALDCCDRLGLAVNLEIKPAAGHERRTGEVVATVLGADWRQLLPQLVLSSFSMAALAAAAKALPDSARALLVGALPRDWRQRCADVGAIAVHAKTAALRRDGAKAVREAGLHLAVYTENDPARLAELAAWGVETVISDRFDLLLHTPVAG
jgi:glycerophosphoryl diester phosphodiesterase